MGRISNCKKTLSRKYQVTEMPAVAKRLHGPRALLWEILGQESPGPPLESPGEWTLPGRRGAEEWSGSNAARGRGWPTSLVIVSVLVPSARTRLKHVWWRSDMS